ncbi:hypothetical protein EON64_00260 [archaeon]|nr:MAG: hypothetical protein EON64_00260 [archaeon]
MVSWTDLSRRALVNAILDEVRHHDSLTEKGNFKSSSWERIFSSFRNETNLIFTKQQLHSQCTELKKKYMTFRNMLSSDGFQLDPYTKLLVAPEEAWEAYLDLDPKAKDFRYRPLAFYEELDEIFNSKAAARKAVPTKRSLEEESYDSTSTTSDEMQPNKKTRNATNNAALSATCGSSRVSEALGIAAAILYAKQASAKDRVRIKTQVAALPDLLLGMDEEERAVYIDSLLTETQTH